MLKRLLLLLIPVTAGLILFFFVALTLFPADIIGDYLVDNARKHHGVGIKYAEIERVFPFGIVATGVEVTRPAGGIAVLIDRVGIEYKVAGLFAGKLRFALFADLLGGRVEAAARLGVRGAEGEALLQSVRPELLPRARLYALSIPVAMSGALSFTAPFKGCAAGTVTLDSDPGGSGELSALGFGLDFGKGFEAGARVELKGCVVDVKRLWLEGDSIVARLSGTVAPGTSSATSRLDLRAEVNEKRTVESNRLLLSFLNAYKVSNGYYSAGITGTAARPVIRPGQ